MHDLNNITQNSTCLNIENGTCLDLAVNDSTSSLKWGLLFLVIVIICTAGGNLLVCLAVCSDRRLQNMTNFFLMSLAIADFLVSIIVMPFGMVVEIYGHFPLEAEYCAFWVTMDVLMCTASIWHMCTMSMDRYFTLKYPMQYGRNKTRTMVAMKIIFVWAVSITISSPICIYGLFDNSSVYVDKQCVITLKHFLIYGSVFAFYIPLCIMILTYLLTIRLLWQNQNMMRTIERSDFRLRPRRSFARPCHIRTMVSPPSSDSRRESHTDISSIARTPVREKIVLPNSDTSDRRLVEMKEIIDNAYIRSLSSNLPSSNNGEICSDAVSIFKNSLDVTKGDDQHDSSIDISHDMLMDDTDLQRSGNKLDNHSNRHKTEVYTPNLSAVTRVQVQSPSEDEDTDERSALLATSNSRNSKSSTNSYKLSQYRIRANTDIAVASGNYPVTHGSLKIPKTIEKQNLQTSVSCSNFYQKPSYDNDGFLGTPCHNGGLANRDYKSLEWCQHFYKIQEEMDECLREAYKERKQLHHLNLIKNQPNNASNQDFNSTNSCQTQDSGVPPSVKKDELKIESNCTGDMSESGDSLDDMDSSSEASDLLTIKLSPKSVYMYKLDVPTKQKQRHKTVKSNGEVRRTSQNGRIAQQYSRHSFGSIDSDKSLEDFNKIQKQNSIRRFIHHCRRKNGFKHFISSKTTSNEKKASKVLGIIFVVFVVLWTPFFCVNILLAICDSCANFVSPNIMSVFVWMGYIASLANPIIYTMFNTAFRRAFIRILCCQYCRHPQRTVMHRSSVPSLAASVYNDRRQTLTVLLNGNQERLQSDITSN